MRLTATGRMGKCVLTGQLLHFKIFTAGSLLPYHPVVVIMVFFMDKLTFWPCTAVAVR